MKLNVGSLPVALLFIGSLLASEGPVIELEAPTGEFQKRDIGLKLSDTAITTNISLTKVSRDTKRLTAAYVGFYQDDLNDSIQFLLAKNHKDDDFLVTAFRVFSHGNQIESVFLEKTELNSEIEITMAFHKGRIFITINGGEVKEVQTNLTDVQAYISVSSGGAKFRNTAYATDISGTSDK